MTVRKTTEQFSEELESKYPGMFKVLSEYKGRQVPIKVANLKTNQEYTIVPKSLLEGMGLSKPKNNKLNKETAQKELDDKYGAGHYLILDDYKSIHTKMQIKCLKHDIVFKQTLVLLRRGYACPLETKGYYA